ncbi:MAG: ATP phosphoribosyltransferase [uncultured bacterium]|uniref:ATP phosphoribosyltransferase n=1 Tax=Candidatus Daviesbacteria bacterium GW2011_GWC2_40_12 TaxID=1618431 RepID=A0A0G0QVS3_9BACT|nr:MAG: ATP phosphoribosyltransferase [uncultured bacterium]KKR15714.1 MAG: ATP phosphoribosyltransferase [Candidatus Daviesbacteria bacterium GW2011_GWA2_39_33]KKR24364.1 MAG: ATP phosphoribosyltransferase [Candidatus Daviesbacteria bacterium GW2011_GWB1_39_5]KKR41451.1 MAG: ATP phosphoribosyltransferase [Candidatus Daviesbacteria bacterium GW2011_GWC2_40_12]OGE22215.1 MAG: ATP phosphoribosyltransferase [Candidatus Daviesbacteria bacterium RIFCSPHIGHO2_01_FULL_40_24]OGE28842.1 MAG: ATP phosph
MNVEKLSLGIQKPTGKTNLGEETVALLAAGELSWKWTEERRDFGPTNLEGLEIVLMRNGDLVPECVRGDVDLVVTGRDKLWNYDYPNQLIEVANLGISPCNVDLCVRQDFPYTKLEDLNNRTIATSYPKGTKRWFNKQGIKVKTIPYEGGEETSVARGKAVACVVVAASGKTIRDNELQTVATLIQSEALMLANSDLKNRGNQTQKVAWNFFRMLVTGLWSTQYVMVDANLPLLDDATLASLPCAKSPTISNLQSGGIATKLMIPRNNLQEARLKIYQTGGEELGQYDIKRLPNLDEPQVTALMRAIWPEWELPTPPWSYLIT